MVDHLGYTDPNTFCVNPTKPGTVHFTGTRVARWLFVRGPGVEGFVPYKNGTGSYDGGPCPR